MTTFGSLLDQSADPEPLFTLAIDVLIALHQLPHAIPNGLRAYDPEQMLGEIELFLDWRTPAISEAGRAEFRAAWRDVLPVAHQVPASLLLRDFHVANLMRLAGRDGIRQVGLLDFQDAYQGPITYDLVSLLEDARRDVSACFEGQDGCTLPGALSTARSGCSSRPRGPLSPRCGTHGCWAFSIG